MKNKHFIDWENETFGFGYGTGEIYTLQVLKDFFNILPKGNYDYEKLEKALTPIIFWLMINILCKANILEYGTSPRYGWLSSKGVMLKDYLKDKTIEELYDLVNVDEDYVHCGKDYCNCEMKCKNPLF